MNNVALVGLFILFLPNPKPQVGIDVIPYINETRVIMDTLDIGIRHYQNLDGKLDVIIDDRLTHLNAMFGVEEGFVTPDNYAKAIYKTPVVAMSKDLHMVLSIGWYYSDSFTVRAKTHMIHEVAHYLQSSNDTADAGYLLNLYNTGREMEYVSYITEIEAFAVESYYWLQFYNQKKLSSIMSLDVSQSDRFKRLIDASRASTNEPPLFGYN